MPQESDEVPVLMRDLGTVRAAAFAAKASDEAYVAIGRAIGIATQAVVESLDHPRDREATRAAREAIDTARELVVRVAAEIERSRVVRERAVQLGVKARPRRSADGG